MSPRRPIRLTEGQIVDWTPSFIWACLTHPIIVGGQEVERKLVRATLRRTVRAWWDWTTALPGELFWDIRRDLLIQVRSGVGASRRIRVLPRIAEQYPTVKALGLASMFNICPDERSEYTWRDLAPAGPTDKEKP